MTEAVRDPQMAEYPMARTCPFDPPPAETEHGPIAKVRIWDGSTPWLVTGYEEHRTAMADPRVSSNFDLEGFPRQVNSRPTTRTFISMDNPEHQRHRRMLIKNFTVKRIETLRDDIQALVDRLIDDLLAGPDHVDLVAAFALPLPSLVICRLLGVPYADHDFFQTRSNRQLTMSLPASEREGARQELSDYLHDLVQKKVENPGDDLISDLVRDQLAPGNVTAREIADMCVLLLIAGHETTANMISLGTLALMQHPDQFAELRQSDDPTLIGSAVEELLRYLSITHMGRRRVALDDMEIAGQRIEAGDGLIFSTEAANRDPAAFDGDPDELDIHRPARHHVAFGFGVHQCLGQALARLELDIAYTTLFRRIPTLAVDAPLDEIEFKDDMFVYGVHALPVTWDVAATTAGGDR